tara:strand:- start:1619 stop:1813 length:195 start_codon:yes stop_codon:yes gene_type:complete
VVFDFSEKPLVLPEYLMTPNDAQVACASVEQFVDSSATLSTQRSISLGIVPEGRPLFVAFRLNQ